MPLKIPTLDDRKFQALLDEARARIPVHNREWTNFNRSDPGITLIEVFAFLTESLLYRANQIPERNRLKFLTLLGISLQPATAARGLVTFANERGPLRTLTLGTGLEVRAGQVPFRTEQGLDVLPIEARAYYKRKLENQPPALIEYYKQLYASFLGTESPEMTKLTLYETVPFPAPGGDGVDLSRDATDNSLWIALLVRATDKPYATNVKIAREAIAGKTLSLGVVPWLAEAGRRLMPVGRAEAATQNLLQFEIARILTNGAAPKLIESSATTDVLAMPGIVQITLPSAPELALENNLQPLEAGVGDLPPALEDTAQSERVITWLRMRSSAGTQARLWWAGINAVAVAQRAHLSNERLPDGTGEPDQTATLSKAPVIPGSVQLTVTANAKPEAWHWIDDLMSAGPEVPTPDLRQPPGSRPAPNTRVNVFTLDPESGVIRFGDGAHGGRPPLNAILRVDYDYSQGREGNVGAGSISTAPALPAGMKVNNPVPTWGGADAETAAVGEKQITRYLQHRDRLVNAADFETITWRAPGVEIGRVEVLPAYNPELAAAEPGDAPGAVTIMVIPKYDPKQPAAPMPDRLFLNSICDYLDSRRLVTTEVFLRGPVYKPIWVSLGLKVVPGPDTSFAEVREAVKQALSQFLSPLPANAQTAAYASGPKGWPLLKPVVDRELLAVASRVPGVLFITEVAIAEGNEPKRTQIEMRGLELPRVLGISVNIGDPLDLNQLRGLATSPPAGDGGTLANVVPVPVVSEECQ